jgi:hypothetical protein
MFLNNVQAGKQEQEMAAMEANKDLDRIGNIAD